MDLCYLFDYQLSGIEHCTSLTELDLDNNQVSDISILANLTNLTKLDLYGNEISDITAVSNLTSLTKLYLWENQISDVSPLANLANLTYLWLNSNKITDISPLVENTGISGIIKLQNNPLSNTALSTHIPALKARGITVEYDEAPTDMIKMSDSVLEAALRQAIDIPTDTLTPSNTSAIVDLDLTNTDVVDLDVEALKALASLKSINLTNNPLSANAVLVQIPELESAGITIDLGTSAATKVELSVTESTLPASLATTTDITITVTDVDGVKVSVGISIA